MRSLGHLFVFDDTIVSIGQFFACNLAAAISQVKFVSKFVSQKCFR